MTTIQFLSEITTIIKLLREQRFKEAEDHTQRAEQVLKDSSNSEPAIEECIILNTVLRGYWNKTPSINLQSIEDAYNDAANAITHSTA